MIVSKQVRVVFVSLELSLRDPVPWDMRPRLLLPLLLVSACTARGFDSDAHIHGLTASVELPRVAEAPTYGASPAPVSVVLRETTIDIDDAEYTWQLQQLCHDGCSAELERIALQPAQSYADRDVTAVDDRLIDTEGPLRHIYGRAEAAVRAGADPIEPRVDLFIDDDVPFGRVAEMLITLGYYGGEDYGLIVDTDDGLGRIPYEAIVDKPENDDSCFELSFTIWHGGSTVVADMRPLDQIPLFDSHKKHQLERGPDGIEDLDEGIEIVRAAYPDLPRCGRVAVGVHPQLPWVEVAPAWASLQQHGLEPYLVPWIYPRRHQGVGAKR